MTTVSISYWPDLSVRCSHPHIHGGIEQLAGSKLIKDIFHYRKALESREKLEKLYGGQLQDFISYIPSDFLDYIGFFGCHHWDLLTAASSGKGFFDLMKSNSFLALMLASVYRFRKYASRKEQIRNICKMKQREIITLFSLRDQEWIAGVLKKVPVHSVYTPVLSDLFHVLRTDHWKKELCHLENLPLSIFSLMNAEKFAPFLNYQLLNEFVYEGENTVVDELSGFLDALSRVQELNKVLQTDFITIPDFSLLSLRRIRKIRHDWLMLPTPSDFEQPLPEAPFQGTDRIRPITGVTELYCEGISMDNCVFSLLSDIQRGGFFIYRILHETSGESMAHFSIRLRDDHQWEVEDIAGPQNDEVDPELEKLIINEIRRTGTNILVIAKDTSKNLEREHPDGIVGVVL